MKVHRRALLIGSGLVAALEGVAIAKTFTEAGSKPVESDQNLLALGREFSARPPAER